MKTTSLQFSFIALVISIFLSGCDSREADWALGRSNWKRCQSEDSVDSYAKLILEARKGHRAPYGQPLYEPNVIEIATSRFMERLKTEHSIDIDIDHDSELTSEVILKQQLSFLAYSARLKNARIVLAIQSSATGATYRTGNIWDKGKYMETGGSLSGTIHVVDMQKDLSKKGTWFGNKDFSFHRSPPKSIGGGGDPLTWWEPSAEFDPFLEEFFKTVGAEVRAREKSKTWVRTDPLTF